MPDNDNPCPDCEWIDIYTYGTAEFARILNHPCDTHKPPPTPLQEAQAEVEEIAARHLGRMPDDRRLIRPGFIFSGYCGGVFGRDSYGTRTVTMLDAEDRWVMLRTVDAFDDSHYFELFQVGPGESAIEQLTEIVTEQIEIDEDNAKAMDSID